MIFRRSERFKRAFQALPASVQKKALKAFVLFADNPRHPSLQIKKIKGLENVWEGQIDRQYRFAFHYETLANNKGFFCIFRNADNHEECLKNP